jgi:hypothetical protein
MQAAIIAPAPPPGSLLPVPKHQRPAVLDFDPTFGGALGTLEVVSEEKRAALQACEFVLEVSSKSFVDLGNALAQIRNEDLFKVEDFPSFEGDYRRKWFYGKQYFNRLIAAAQAFRSLVTNCHQTKPDHEPQVRPLIGLPPDQAQVAWEKALQKAGTRKVTARLVKAAVKEVVPQEPGPAAPKKPKLADIKAQCFQAMTELVILISHRTAHETLLQKGEALHRQLAPIIGRRRKVQPA